MKNFRKWFTPTNFLSKNLRGFTLIELLIVIALLGALAVGLLAALDPFEQLKKGTDTGVRNTLSETQGASIRFYAIKNYMPWCANATTCADPASPGVSLTNLNGAAYNTAINNIVATGELKGGFVTLAGAQMDQIFVTGTNSPPTIAVCFTPSSKSFSSDPNTKYGRDGSTPHTGTSQATCPTNKPGDDCWYCVK